MQVLPMWLVQRHPRTRLISTMDEVPYQHEYDGLTVLNPLGLMAILVLGTAMLLVPRRYAVWPMIIMGCFVAPAQRVAIFTLNFDLLRIMVIFGTVRILARDEWRRFTWRSMDSVLLAFAVVGTSIYLLQYETLDAVKYKLGVMYDILGMYFSFFASWKGRYGRCDNFHTRWVSRWSRRAG